MRGCLLEVQPNNYGGELLAWLFDDDCKASSSAMTIAKLPGNSRLVNARKTPHNGRSQKR
eukprot:1395079-Amphidinium_carterae.1